MGYELLGIKYKLVDFLLLLWDNIIGKLQHPNEIHGHKKTNILYDTSSNFNIFFYIIEKIGILQNIKFIIENDIIIWLENIFKKRIFLDFFKVIIWKLITFIIYL